MKILQSQTSLNADNEHIIQAEEIIISATYELNQRLAQRDAK
jgi:hypothetical protein